ncbi:hypothetical protein K2W90_00245 [Candidatus Babeliales bacterium]|nr:hypothetical protein [Candidatus Babeliales bacterium]
MKKILFLVCLALTTSSAHAYTKKDLEKASQLSALGMFLEPTHEHLTKLATTQLPDFKNKELIFNTISSNVRNIGRSSIVVHSILRVALENDTDLLEKLYCLFIIALVGDSKFLDKIYGLQFSHLANNNPFSTWTEQDKKVAWLRVAQFVAQDFSESVTNRMVKKFLSPDNYRLVRRAIRTACYAAIRGGTVYLGTMVAEKYNLTAPCDKQSLFWTEFIKTLITQTCAETCGELVVLNMTTN